LDGWTDFGSVLISRSCAALGILTGAAAANMTGTCQDALAGMLQMFIARHKMNNAQDPSLLMVV
jgi:hypothetical protein